MLALSEPRLGHHPLNHARSVIWYLFDEHGEGFYILPPDSYPRR